MTLETFKSVKPRSYEEYLQYVFMQVAPEDVGVKDDFEDNFDNWLAEQDIDYIMRHADAYAGLVVSNNVCNQSK